MADENEQPHGRRFFNHFVGGIAWGIGTSIGIVIGLSIFAYIVTKINFVPVIGAWLAQVLAFAIQEVAKRPPTIPR